MVQAALPLPQVGQDIPSVLDPAIVYASRAGEHMSVGLNASEHHMLRAHVGDTWKGVHVAKVDAFHGGPRTLFNQVNRWSSEKYEIPLGYTVSLLFTGKDMQYMAASPFLKQMGPQLSEAIARDVDRQILTSFSTAAAANLENRGAAAIRAGDLLERIFRLQAAADESSSMIQIISPTAHHADLVHEFTTTGNNSAIVPIARPLSDAANRMLTTDSAYMVMGMRIKQGKNSPTFGTQGYTGVFRKTAIKIVTAPVMSRSVIQHPLIGGGAQLVMARKWWGFGIPPWANRNWLHAVRANMPFGGK